MGCGSGGGSSGGNGGANRRYDDEVASVLKKCNVSKDKIFSRR